LVEERTNLTGGAFLIGDWRHLFSRPYISLEKRGREGRLSKAKSRLICSGGSPLTLKKREGRKTLREEGTTWLQAGVQEQKASPLLNFAPKTPLHAGGRRTKKSNFILWGSLKEKSGAGKERVRRLKGFEAGPCRWGP